MFSSSDEVYDVRISYNYILLSVTYKTCDLLQFGKLSLNNFHALKYKQFSLHLCALNITGEEAGQSKNMN